MLSNFQLGAHPLLQTLLLGQPEFKRLLASSDELEQLRQRVIAAHHLEAMQPGEIEPYVHHRLKHVGWDGEPDFERGLFTRIHKATGGIPRKINQVMTRLLLLGAVEEQSTIDLAMLDAVIEEMTGDSSAEEAVVEVEEEDEPVAVAVLDVPEAEVEEAAVADVETLEESPALVDSAEEAPIAEPDAQLADEDEILEALIREEEEGKEELEAAAAIEEPTTSFTVDDLDSFTLGDVGTIEDDEEDDEDLVMVPDAPAIAIVTPDAGKIRFAEDLIEDSRGGGRRNNRARRGGGARRGPAGPSNRGGGRN